MSRTLRESISRWMTADYCRNLRVPSSLSRQVQVVQVSATISGSKARTCNSACKSSFLAWADGIILNYKGAFSPQIMVSSQVGRASRMPETGFCKHHWSDNLKGLHLLRNTATTTSPPAPASTHLSPSKKPTPVSSKPPNSQAATSEH